LIRFISTIFGSLPRDGGNVETNVSRRSSTLSEIQPSISSGIETSGFPFKNKTSILRNIPIDDGSVRRSFPDKSSLRIIGTNKGSKKIELVEFFNPRKKS
jgi:hypothetical protein